MQKLFCLRHPEVDPVKAPELSCKVCCKIYISNVKQRQAVESGKKNAGNQTSTWLAERERLQASQGYHAGFPTDLI